MGSVATLEPFELADMAPAKTARPRLDNVDLVRGLVMVIMALDHVRDYLAATSYEFNPVDLNQTTSGVFLTRWITHFCAPVFTFLAGTGAFLAGSRGMTRKGLSWFLLSRGLWLVILELVVVRLSWEFAFNYEQPNGSWWIGAGTLWSIGWSMVVLSVLCFLPTSAVTAIGLAIVAFHNHFDHIRLETQDLGWFGPLWGVLHSSEKVKLMGGPFLGMNLPDVYFQSGYGVLPWVGAMCCGYGLGALFLLDRPTRRRQLIGLGVALTLLFIGLRYTNIYGDLSASPTSAAPPGPGPWSEQSRGPEFTVFSFLNCQKYPPSLLYLLMTLGPAIVLLGLCDRDAGPIGRFLIIFGRVPLFFYLLHIPLIHAIGILIDEYRFGH
jgi:uncharacterized membrane protein